MGNDLKPLLIQNYIRTYLKPNKFEVKKEVENELLELCQNHFYNREEIILKNNFKYLIQLSNPDIFNLIFEIFGRKGEKNDIISFNDIKYFYVSFKTNDSKVKAVVIAFLLFQNKENLLSNEIKNNIFNIFKGDLITQDILLKQFGQIIMNNDVIASKNKNKNKKKLDNFNIKNYINKILENKDYIENFKFIKSVLGSSVYKFNLVKNEKLNYICDCAKVMSEKNIQDNLESMKNVFESITANTNKVLYLNNFKKILEDSKIHKNIINLVLDYFKKSTLKDYFGFNDLKYIFSNLNYSLPLIDKKKFLFKIISSINNIDKKGNKLTYNQIEKYLNIDYNEDNDKNHIDDNSELFNEEDFMKDKTFEDMFNKLNPYLENFGLLPYLIFKVKTDDKIIKRRLIKDILKNENIDNHEKYLENKFEEYDFFYAVNIKFWNILMDDSKEAPDYINNSEIVEEINIVKKEDELMEQITKLKNSQAQQNKGNEKIHKDEKKENTNKEKDEENATKSNKKEEENKSNKKNEGDKNNDDNKIKEKKEDNNKNEIKDDNKNKNIIQEKNNEENKIKDNNKETDEKKEKIEKKNNEIITKLGKLKKGLTYKKDFILLCGQLYQIIRNNYRIDYIIKLTKIKTIIDLNKNKSNEEKKDKDKEKEGEPQNDNLKKNNDEEENDEEYINNEKLVKEKLDEFIIDEDKGFMSKIVKYKKGNNENNENIYILNELDFYPIQVYQKSFGIIVRAIENAKLMYDKLEKEKKFYELTPKEQRIKKREEEREREKEIENLQKKKQKYYDEKEIIEINRSKELITRNEYENQLRELQNKYEDIFQKREKNQNDYEVDITMTEFIDNLVKYKNTLLLEKKDEINVYPRYKTFNDIKKFILSNNKFLKEKKFDIYYFLFSTETIFKPNEDYTLEAEGKESDQFLIIIVDIYSDKGENFNQLLIDKEKAKKEPELIDNKKKDIINKNQDKKIRKTDIRKNKKVEQEKHKLTEEEKNKIKEQKLEKERLEKERKLKEKQEREKYEKMRKEEEKKRAQIEKEKKQKEKEELQRQKQIQKEKELELKRQRELEKYIRPPYGINNYGNTCYFNSVNQIFLNLPILQQIFLNPKIKYFINRKNKFGRQGKFFDIYQSLYWIKKTKVGETVLSLKSLVGKIKEDFNNTTQQDANEYLNLVLENLHEELNMHSSKIYIEEKDDIFKHNNEEELGNISWANNLKRNCSFIDSIFMFQLKSNLKCRKCNTTKFNFETNYIIDLPLSLCKMVTVDIYLYRLPFIYKLYYDKINKKFEDYINNDLNKNLSIVHNLWNYYTNVLSIEEKKQQVIRLHFCFDLEREKKMMDITKIIRGIKPLDIEPERIIETFNNEKITEYKVEHLTDFITYSKEKDEIIYPDSEIDKYVNVEDKIILNIYEVLNTNGMKKLFEEENKNKNINLYTYLYKNTSLPNINTYIDTLKDSFFIKGNKDNIINNQDINTPNNSGNTINENMEIKKETFNILAFKEQMVIFPKEEITIDTRLSRKISTEFAIPILHYWRANKKSTFLFRDFYHIAIKEFPVQYIILSNTYNINAKQLYEYIWNLNIIYMNHPNMNTKEFWWNNLTNENSKEDDKNNKDNINIKKCYPFVLRYTEIPEKISNNNNLLHCSLCPWYSFCPGCIIDPRSDIKNLSSKCGIVVDWCYSFVIEEFQTFNFYLNKEIDSQVISENLPVFDKDQNYQSINDCFNLFFDEENLEDPLYCHNCQGPEDFSKRYTINKLPYVLILSLKRFKYNKNYNFKLRQMITYPLYDLEIGNDKIKKKYDLYGVINHYGSIRGGHYTCIIKNKDKEWILCNDSNVYKIEENRVMHANAYILFYISKESPFKNDYFRYMKSFMNDIIIKEEKENKETPLIKNVNFFKGEPVKTKYGEGYVIKENSNNFKYDETYDIYDDLKKADDLRVENLNKKYQKEDNNKNDTKKENKEKDVKDQEKTNKQKDENNTENTNKENNKNDNKAQNKEENEINENKIKESNENKINIKDENDKSNNINDKHEHTQDEEISTNKNEEKIEEKEGDNISLPEYYNNFVEIKFDFGKGWINKKDVEKYNTLDKKEGEKGKNIKNFLFSMIK